MSLMTSLIKPDQICSLLSNERSYQQQKERLGVVLHEGWRYWDQYQAMRPYLFWGSVVTMVASGYGWYKRGLKRRARDSIESHLMYPGLLALSGGVAYITRPDWLMPSPIQQAEAEAGEGAGAVAFLDQKAAELRSRNPRFVDDAFDRTLNVPGIKGVWRETPEHVKAMIHCREDN